MELMFRPLARYADFQGRARRSEYWLWALFRFILSVIMFILQYALIIGAAASSAASGQAEGANATGAAGAVGLLTLLNWVIILGLLLPHTAVAVRRLHDTNRSGWWVVFPYVVGLVALIVVFTLNSESIINSAKSVSSMSNPGNSNAGLALALQIFRAMIWVIVPFLLAKLLTFIFRVTEGTPGSNRFGPNPKGPGGNIDVF